MDDAALHDFGVCAEFVREPKATAALKLARITVFGADSLVNP